MKGRLINIFNTLYTVSVNGDNIITMANVLLALKQIIDELEEDNINGDG